MLPRRLIATLAVFTTLGVATVGCSGDDSADEVSTVSSTEPTADSTGAERTSTTTTTTTEPIADRRPFVATKQALQYTRTTDGGVARVLETDLWYPDGDGPFPLVAFAHGNDGHPRKFSQLFTAWAEAGYAVVAPRFPVSADDAGQDLATSVADAPQQDLDLDFVVQQVRADSAAGAVPVTIDPDRLVVAGLSLGGGTALRSSYSDCCPNLRPSLVIAFSPVTYATTQEPDAPPLLLVHGTADLSLPYSGTVDYFATSTVRRWFVTLDNGSHADPYEDTSSPFDDLIVRMSIGWLDEYLYDDTTGVSRASAEIEASGTAHLQSAD